MCVLLRRLEKLLRNIFKILIHTIILLIVFLIVLEIVLRIIDNPTYAPNTPGYLRTHIDRRYELTPNFSGKSHDAELNINSNGLRDEERDITAGNDSYRIAVFGDSFTFGQGVELEETFSKVFEKKLNEHYKIPIQVFNFGVPSYNTIQEEMYMKEVYDKYKPHSVFIIYYAGNDSYELELEDLNKSGLVRKVKDWSRNFYSYNWLALRFYRLVYILKWEKGAVNEQDARMKHDRGLYADDYKGWIEAQNSFKRIVRFCNEKEVDLVFAIIANNFNLGSSAEEDPMYHVVQKIITSLKNTGVEKIILLDESYRKYRGNEEILFVRPDDSHFSVLAHKEVGEYLFNWFKKLEKLE